MGSWLRWEDCEISGLDAAYVFHPPCPSPSPSPHPSLPPFADDIAARLAAFGENRFPEPPFESWWSLFFECFKDAILIVLMVASVVSLAIGTYEHPDYVSGVAWGANLGFLPVAVASLGVECMYSGNMRHDHRNIRQLHQSVIVIFDPSICPLLLPQGFIDGLAIMLAVFIVAAVTATNDYNKQLQFRALQSESQARIEVHVIRSGQRMAVPTWEVR